MKAGPVLLDTNLLVLFVVGLTSKDLIERHKRLSEFVPEDYDALLRILKNASEVLVTPNTLTETSNLAAHIAEPARARVFATLREVIARSTEVTITSKTAAAREEFVRLGLTDAAIISATREDTVLLTTDLSLYLATIAVGSQALNFNHIRDEYLTTRYQ